MPKRRTERTAVADHTADHAFYDVAGHPMAGGAFRKKYPARCLIRRWVQGNLLICTEFVGINHTDKPGRLAIYETTVTVRYTHVVSAWTGGYKRAVAMHYWVCLRAVLGGLLWWRVRERMQ